MMTDALPAKEEYISLKMFFKGYFKIKKDKTQILACDVIYLCFPYTSCLHDLR